MKLFVQALFGHQTHVDGDVKDLLFASVLRFYDELCTFVRNEPLGE